MLCNKTEAGSKNMLTMAIVILLLTSYCQASRCTWASWVGSSTTCTRLSSPIARWLPEVTGISDTHRFLVPSLQGLLYGWLHKQLVTKESVTDLYFLPHFYTCWAQKLKEKQNRKKKRGKERKKASDLHWWSCSDGAVRRWWVSLEKWSSTSGETCRSTWLNSHPTCSVLLTMATHSSASLGHKKESNIIYKYLKLHTSISYTDKKKPCDNTCLHDTNTSLKVPSYLA